MENATMKHDHLNLIHLIPTHALEQLGTLLLLLVAPVAVFTFIYGLDETATRPDALARCSPSHNSKGECA